MAYKSLHHTFHPSSRPKSPNISLFLYFASNPNIFYPPQISYLSVDLQSLLQLFLPSGMLLPSGREQFVPLTLSGVCSNTTFPMSLSVTTFLKVSQKENFYFSFLLFFFTALVLISLWSFSPYLFKLLQSVRTETLFFFTTIYST